MWLHTGIFPGILPVTCTADQHSLWKCKLYMISIYKVPGKAIVIWKYCDLMSHPLGIASIGQRYTVYGKYGNFMGDPDTNTARLTLVNSLGKSIALREL